MDYLNTRLSIVRDISEGLSLKYPEDIRKVRDILEIHLGKYFSDMPHVKRFSKLTGCNDVSQAVYCLDLHSWNTAMAVKYFQENAVKVNLQ